MGHREWDANFMIFQAKYDPSAPTAYYDGRQVISLPVVLARNGTISDGGAGLTIIVMDKNENPIATIMGSYTGTRMNLGSDNLCHFTVTPPIP